MLIFKPLQLIKNCFGEAERSRHLNFGIKVAGNLNIFGKSSNEYAIFSELWLKQIADK
jgi:hypothetical protein